MFQPVTKECIRSAHGIFKSKMSVAKELAPGSKIHATSLISRIRRTAEERTYGSTTL
jgi:hypothetical protein